jgi:hypothetical protein
MLANRMYRIVTTCLLAGAFASVLPAPAMAKKRATMSPACRSTSVIQLLEAEPKELIGAPEPAVLNRFGVLRRAAGPADQLPPLNRIGSRLGLELNSYYPGYIRQLFQLPNGSRYFLIPGLKRLPELPPGRCLPKQLRHQRQPKSEPVYCIAGIGPNVSTLSRVGCQTLAEIETGADLAEPSFSSSFQIDLVPDGVATVRLVYRGGTVVTAPVSENAFTFTPPREPIARVRAALKRLERAFENERTHRHKHVTKRQRTTRAVVKVLNHLLSGLPPKQVQWLNAGGHVLRSFKPTQPRNSLIVTGSFVTSTGAVPVG